MTKKEEYIEITSIPIHQRYKGTWKERLDKIPKGKALVLNGKKYIKEIKNLGYKTTYRAKEDKTYIYKEETKKE